MSVVHRGYITIQHGDAVKAAVCWCVCVCGGGGGGGAETVVFFVG